jgi:hypothetical protein
MRQIFRLFYVKQFGTGHLHNCLSLCDFDFEFSEIYVLENRFLVVLTRGVADFAYISVIRQVESLITRITEFLKAQPCLIGNNS